MKPKPVIQWRVRSQHPALSPTDLQWNRARLPKDLASIPPQAAAATVARLNRDGYPPGSFLMEFRTTPATALQPACKPASEPQNLSQTAAIPASSPKNRPKSKTAASHAVSSCPLAPSH